MRVPPWLIAIAACGTGAVAPVGPTAHAPPPLCAGLDDDACQERALTQSLCLQAPDTPGCEDLRLLGRLPPPPPDLRTLYGCWQVERPRGDLPAAWVCLDPAELAIDGYGGWELWDLDSWRREDAPARAGWSTDLSDGRTVWLTVVATRPDLVLHLDDAGALAATLVAGDPGARAEAERELAALPSIAAVCGAARACVDAIPGPTVAASDAEVAPPTSAEAELLAAAHSLRTCEQAWRAAALRLDATVHRAAIPATCAHQTPDSAYALSQLVPPYAEF